MKCMYILNWIGWKVHEIIKAFDKLSNLSKQAETTARQELLVRWCAPVEGWVKLNVDGASKGNPGIAGGGVLRDHYGNWIQGFACNLGWCSSVKAEFLAL